MITIDVGTETAKHQIPKTWAEVAKHLGTSRQQLNVSRSVLEMMSAPINAKSVEKLRQITEFCKRRDTGGGGSCTRQEYVRLTLSGQLDERLRDLKII